MRGDAAGQQVWPIPVRRGRGACAQFGWTVLASALQLITDNARWAADTMAAAHKITPITPYDQRIPIPHNGGILGRGACCGRTCGCAARTACAHSGNDSLRHSNTTPNTVYFLFHPVKDADARLSAHLGTPPRRSSRRPPLSRRRRQTYKEHRCAVLARNAAYAGAGAPQRNAKMANARTAMAWQQRW